MNTPTLGTFCSARIGRADIDVASRAVDTSSRARQLCYPRSNFLVNTSPQSRRTNGSLDLTFVTDIHLVRIPVRLTFALALYTGFLTRLSQPLGAIDIFSTACHPSQTVHLQLSPVWVKRCKISEMVLHWRLHMIWRSYFKRLPFTLYKKSHNTTTGYSKVSRGLHFPLEFSGFCTGKEFSEGTS